MHPIGHIHIYSDIYIYILTYIYIYIYIYNAPCWVSATQYTASQNASVC